MRQHLSLVLRGITSASCETKDYMLLIAEGVIIIYLSFFFFSLGSFVFLIVFGAQCATCCYLMIISLLFVSYIRHVFVVIWCCVTHTSQYLVVIVT